MLRNLRELGFWPHHILMALIALLLITLPRITGASGGEHFHTLALRGALQISVSYPLFTLGAYMAMTGLPEKTPLIVRALIGCLLAAPIISLIGPVATWSFGVMPPNVYLGSGRADLLHSIQTGYWRILLGFSTLGAGIWMFLNFEWWRFRLAPADSPVESGIQRSADQIVSTAAPSRAPHNAAPAFVRRLSPEKRGELWALTAEQHYLRVYTSRGDDLILMRFSDAVGELAHNDGLQVHRSHWVASAGIERLDDDSGKLFVVLKNGVRLPVSRPNIAAARLIFERRSESGPDAGDRP